MPAANATFLAFKPSGKWKYEGRGLLSDAVFGVFATREQRQQILADNGGKLPGMNSAASDLIWVVVPDEEHPSGFPLMLHPTEEA